MLNQVIEQIQPLLGELCWVHMNCGLSKMAVRTTPTEKQSYPVSVKCKEAECWSNGIYKQLTPNGRDYSSLLYWESVRGVSLDPNRRVGKRDKYSAELDLIVWLNLPKLGYEACDSSSAVLNDILRMLNEKVQPTNSLSNIEFNFKFQHDFKGVRNVFNKYTYGNQERLFFYPYEALAFRVEACWFAKIDCLPEFECKEEIECTTL